MPHKIRIQLNNVIEKFILAEYLIGKNLKFNAISVTFECFLILIVSS